MVPLPMPDSNRPYGSQNCEECKRYCHGHYLKPDTNLHNIQSNIHLACRPPSVVINQTVMANKLELSDTQIGKDSTIA